MRQAVGEAVTLELALADEPLATHVDATQLETALLNLAVNARDAMPEGGRLTIATRREAGPSALGYVAIEVRDTGVGMDEAVRSRVFEPFFTTKDIGKGSGLGLSQVYGFVSQSDGEVRLESEPGQGTAFHLLLPATSEAAEPRREVPVGKMVGGTERILLVEDDATVLALTLDVLSGLGYQVVTATNAAEALAALQADAGIDLLFTDVVMPGGVSGLSLARTARELRPALRVLLTSGFVGENRVIDGREFPLLDKPYESAVLASTLRKLLDRPERRRRKRESAAAE
jgi:CheY-like chemotaxis protein